jgi:multidrug efflux pump subunit AcrB
MVNDDFGSEYGILFAIHGDGYSLKEIEDYAKFLRKELLRVAGVARVEFWGAPQEVITIELERSRLAGLDVPVDALLAELQRNNQAVDAGAVTLDDRRLRIELTGRDASWETLGDLLLAGSAGSTVRLRDIAVITRSQKHPPSAVLRVDGKPAVGFGIATEEGGNVVTTGDNVSRRLAELEPRRPVGMKLHTISFQGETVRQAVNGFVVSVFQALAIVIAVLMIFMGLRSGVIIGIVLLLIVCGTFVVMDMMRIDLQRISLGALIVALGMLVDNAIVVTDGILVGIAKGRDRVKSAAQIVQQTAWPLLGATIVAIMAFAAIGFSPDSTGEYCKSLFQVIAISLLWSWVLAVTVTPLLCVDFLKSPKNKQRDTDNQSRPVRLYRRLLGFAIIHRRAVLLVTATVLIAGLYGFSKVPPAFFPQSARPQFVLDYWLPQGTHIDRTIRDTERLEEFVLQLDGVESVSTWVGRGALRFMLVYSPEDANSAYAQLLVTVEDHRHIDSLIPQIRRELADHYLDAQTKLWKFVLGPGGGSAIEARFSGPDQDILRSLSNEARNIMSENPNSVNVKDDWRQPVQVARARLRETVMKRLGVSRADVAAAMQIATEGQTVGVYRQDDDVLPLVAQLADDERNTMDRLDQITVLSRLTGEPVPVAQLVSGWDLPWENPIIRRRNREKTITAQCDPAIGLSSELLTQLRPKIEAMTLPPGYRLEWGGDYEDSTQANAGIAATMPVTFVIMVVLIVMLFNAIRQPLIIFLTVPLAIVGVAAGLLITRVAFDFMAVLGFLSLTGMLIKNSVVLIDQMDSETRSRKTPFDAVVDSTVDRTRPVLMAAVTTVLGLIPLLTDVFFRGLSVVIMFGLSFAAVLTLVIVPVLYSAFFKVNPDDASA